MSDLFISYSRHDRSLAERLARALEAEGWTIWWDRKIPAGRRFSEVITRELGAARCVLVVWSKHSVGSDWVLSEADKALERKVLVPLSLDDSPIPMPFDRVQATSLASWKGDAHHTGYRKLVSSIAERLGEQPPPAPEEHRTGTWRRIPKRFQVSTIAAGLLALAAVGWAVWRWLEPASKMALVEAGEFLMGTSADETGATEGEVPRHRVLLDAFYIDRYEVTVADFRSYLEKEKKPFKWSEQQGEDNEPVVGVSWAEARQYCDEQGKSLPTEAQWEKAARGTDARTRIYPWGNDRPDGSQANFCDRRCSGESAVDDGYSELSPVGAYPLGASPYGVYDLAGNVGEWVEDWFDRDVYRLREQITRNPVTLQPSERKEDQGLKVVRGGSFESAGTELRSAYRSALGVSATDLRVGFRCVKVVS